MSQFNGDKARYNRERKQNASRRLRTRALLDAAGLKVAKTATSKKPSSAAEKPAS